VNHSNGCNICEYGCISKWPTQVVEDVGCNIGDSGRVIEYTIQMGAMLFAILLNQVRYLSGPL
jgi:hypothetical protein